jgi:thiol-disulfide isomerase/thioredoxin
MDRVVHLLQRSAVVLAALLSWAGLLPAAELKPAPPLSATLLDGTRFSSADHKGKVILVNFWATWCAPCREEMPAIDAFYRRHREGGLEVLAISLDEARDAAMVQRIVSPYAFSVTLSAQARYGGLGRIWRVPMTFVIDRQGRLRQDITGDIAQVDLAFLEAKVAPLLQ